ncbi:MAG: VOC family protein [Gammaproteobacteria bacterium]|nr:VOC family protein [Gammaproteobacteria bacterium]MDH3467397.1 VOC family protein [Gammaproteobacteria bacterium]
MHKSRLGALIIDCQFDDLRSDAKFWSAAFGQKAESADEQVDPKYVRLGRDSPDVRILLQQVDHPSRVHIDIETDDLDAEVERLQRIGAALVERRPKWVVLEAPSGH